ncbi:MAG TPA: class I SAM-dependent rRNA methyltransferase [Planctomycetota bacterium]|nr:class I SAM-dependent rRNA methyltransferase [Planctomycetota bacterium]
MAKVFLKQRKARPFWFGHPWVFSGAIDRVRGKVKDGEIVELCDFEGQVIGTGFYNSKSQIQVRLVARAPEGELSTDLLLERVDRAIALRHEVLRLPERTNAYRLIHGEGDGIPGLVVDRLDSLLVLQISCLGLVSHLDPILARLMERMGPVAIVERRSAIAEEEEGLLREEGVLRGTLPQLPLNIHEDGLQFPCDPVSGQKTGFYTDQRDNHLALAPLARGRRVLDAFSYMGGFGLRMAKEGAASVHLLDSSEAAIALAEVAIARNGLSGKVTTERGNVLRQLEHDHTAGKTYDMVVLDPPKFVHKRSALERGLKLYAEVNRKGVLVLENGGILVTCSCSQHVSAEHFEEMLGAVGHQAGVRFQEIYRGGQAPDHPVLLPLAESRYLKCRAYRVWKSAP